jgi:hypothetical protein
VLDKLKLTLNLRAINDQSYQRITSFLPDQLQHLAHNQQKHKTHLSSSGGAIKPELFISEEINNPHHSSTRKQIKPELLSVGPEHTRAVNRNRANLWEVPARYGALLSKYHTL